MAKITLNDGAGKPMLFGNNTIRQNLEAQRMAALALLGIKLKKKK